MEATEPNECSSHFTSSWAFSAQCFLEKAVPVPGRETNKPKGSVTREFKDVKKPRCGKSSPLVLVVYSFKGCY